MSEARLRRFAGASAAAAGAFSQAVECDGWLFLAGQVASDCADEPGNVPDDVRVQTHMVMRNLAGALARLGAGLTDVVSARVFLTQFARDYAPMNEIYRSYFAADRLPARTCVGVTALAGGMRVEIDMTARLAGGTVADRMA